MKALFKIIFKFSPVIIYPMLMVLMSCSRSLEDYQEESERICLAIVQDLEKVETREDLLKVELKLSKRFHHLIDLMIAIKQQKLDQTESHFENSSNDKLLLELKRVYRLEGGREIIERSQREALIRLDAFERSLAKKKQLPKK